MWGKLALWAGSLCFFSGRCIATTGNSRNREELAPARRTHTPLAEARCKPEVKWRGLEQEEPELQVSTEEANTGPRPEVEGPEDVDPGERIEEMEENWTTRASTPAAPGAVLQNVRSVYSELSDEVLVSGGYDLMRQLEWRRNLTLKCSNLQLAPSNVPRSSQR